MVRSAKERKDDFTYEDLCSWPDDERWELIDGVAYDMSPAPLRVHADISKALLVAFELYLRGKPCKVYHAPFDVRLPLGEESDNQIKNVVQPDILVICDEKKLDDKGCRGAPDLVIEILSPTTASRDCIKKRALYERHGVKEFWTIDPTNRLVHVYLLDSDGRYSRFTVYGDSDVVNVSIFDDLQIDLKEIFPLQVKVVRESPKQYKSK